MIFTRFLILFFDSSTLPHLQTVKPGNNRSIANAKAHQQMWMWWVLKMMPHVTYSWGLLILSAEHVTMLIFNPFIGKPASEKSLDRQKQVTQLFFNELSYMYFDSQCLTKDTILQYKTPKDKRILGNHFHSWCVAIVRVLSNLCWLVGT